MLVESSVAWNIILFCGLAALYVHHMYLCIYIHMLIICIYIYVYLHI